MLDLTHPQIIAFIGLSLALLAVIRAKLRPPPGLPLPPGPPGHWLIGNTIPTILYVWL
jgi:hypothetical protein